VVSSSPTRTVVAAKRSMRQASLAASGTPRVGIPSRTTSKPVPAVFSMI
jgi:hypothetical protein